METRPLGLLSAALWLLACACCVAIALDVYQRDGDRASVWLVGSVDLGLALWTTSLLVKRASAAEVGEDEWRAKWGSEVGPYRLVLARLVWAIEESIKDKGRPARVDAPDLLLRAERLTKIERTRATL